MVSVEGQEQVTVLPFVFAFCGFTLGERNSRVSCICLSGIFLCPLGNGRRKTKVRFLFFCFLPFFLFSDTTIILSGTAALG